MEFHKKQNKNKIKKRQNTRYQRKIQTLFL